MNLKEYDLKTLLLAVMKSEVESREVYESLKELLEDDEERKMLQILASMEQGHYDILSKELENMERFEDYDTYWPMMHAGP